MDHEGPQNRIIQIDEALVTRELSWVVRLCEKRLRRP